MEKEKRQKAGAIIVAAGKSQRMGGVDKILAPLAGKPVLARVVDVFQECRSIDQIVVVLSQQNMKRGEKLVAESGWSKVSLCPGGERRQNSVLAGLNRLNPCNWVVIHDGARPLVTVDLIEEGLAAAQETGSAVAAVPVTDTIKMAGEDCLVRETPPRQTLWAAQTPQVFRFDIIAEAYRQAKGDVTDDATLVERLGYRVKLYMGSYDNIKVTKSSDLALAEALLRQYDK